MPKVENLDVPSGWLIDPHEKWAIHFDFKEGSMHENSADFTIDMWGVVTSGQPMEFKSRRKVSKEESIKTWKQLISSNWIEFDFDRNQTA